MTSRDFCFWLQGVFELRDMSAQIPAIHLNIIQRHLNLVFKHEIDPTMGDEKHQEELNSLHQGTTTIRC